MNNPSQNRWLRFDRMLSDSLWKQFTWIICILIILWGISFVLLSLSGYPWYQFCDSHDVRPWLMPLYLLIDTNALNNLYLNTTDDGAAHGWMLIVSSITYLFGLFIFNGVIISVLSNYIAQRKDSYMHGISRYAFSGHYVIMGYDDMVPSIIADIFRRNPEAQILVLSAAETIKIRERIRKSVKREYVDRIIVNYGHRIAKEYYPDIHLESAKEIFVVGKRVLPDHDAVNIECVESILDYLSNFPIESNPKRITCVFEDFDTYSAFKLADIFTQARKLRIDFVPYNYYVGWAKQVFIARQYYSTHDDKCYTYPSLYRSGIGYNDEHHVHLVFVGTSTFAVAFAMEAAQLLHFPNGTSYSVSPEKPHTPIRTKITFIDKNADTEMLLFRTRNRHFFEIQSCSYVDMTTNEIKEELIPATVFKGEDGDFLDIDFEFIKGDVYSDLVQEKLSEWATDEKQYLSLFLAHSNQRDNFCLGMNMPDAIYEHDVPIFIRQDNADTFVTDLRLVHADKKKFYTTPDGKTIEEKVLPQRYAHLYPFGMNNTAYYQNEHNTLRAQLYNYLYETADYGKLLFTDIDKLRATPVLPLIREAQERWQKLPIAHKWSNIYAVEMIPCKLASMEMMQQEQRLTEEQTNDCMAEVEHNRWNVEKLLMGYRKPKSSEDKYSITGDDSDAEMSRKMLQMKKNSHYIHHDIRPYSKLDKIKELDMQFTQYIPWIVMVDTEIK